ncbi:MAG: capsular biosynthesis protein [Cycloclasticus sp.]|nr:MAG: capsular biosynthesis protein [Cycloclasticus sp.]
MIDLHSHLLPGIDDGSPDIQTSIELASLAVEDGITHMVCTPHIHAGRYENTLATIQSAKIIFEEALKQQGVDLNIATAAEVRFDIELMTSVKNGDIPLLGEWHGKKVILLEFPHGEIPFAAERLTSWLLEQNIIPMIAHPERNKGLLKTPSKLNVFIQQGCLLQVTAGAVAGGFGVPARELATKLLAQGHVTVLATDAHNQQHRPPVLSDGVEAAAHIIGQEKAYQLVQQNPWEIARSLF